jgi:hypothetical protein
VCGGESTRTPDSVPAVPENRRWRPSLSAGGCPPAPAAYPGVSADGPSSPCVALLPVGFAEPPGSPRVLVRSYRTVSPLPVPVARPSAVCFLWHFPAGHPDWALPSTLPCGVRTFLGPVTFLRRAGTRPPGRLATANHCRAPQLLQPPNRREVPALRRGFFTHVRRERREGPANRVRRAAGCRRPSRATGPARGPRSRRRRGRGRRRTSRWS